MALTGAVLYAVAGAMPYGTETRRRAAVLIQRLPGLPKLEKVHEYCDGIIEAGRFGGALEAASSAAPPAAVSSAEPAGFASSPGSASQVDPADVALGAPAAASPHPSDAAPAESWANDEWDRDRELTFRGSAAFLSACHLALAACAWRRLKRG